ncbi:MAG TPA: glycosyltransferase family 2 protein [Thermoanaerobaculia bacterium]
MSNALVSTVIPVFNRAAMLREAVESVLAQTHRPIEILIVDDGSTDDTPAVADELAREHAGVVRAFHQANGGAGLARERARGEIRGSFVQHLDSDDLLLPRKFELQVAALNVQPQCGAAYGWTRFRHRDGRAEEQPWKRSGERIETMFPAMLAERWWDTPTPLYRASLIREAGPWTDLRVEEDWEYDCRIAARSVRLAYVPEWVCEVRQHDQGHVSGHADAGSLRERARAHLLMLRHARDAGLANESPEMRHFARDLFHIARQCGVAGLAGESRSLVAAAQSISPSRDLRVYALAARALGWRRMARLAQMLDR